MRSSEKPLVKAYKCSCPPGFCIEFQSRAALGFCIHKLPGVVEQKYCDKCGAPTWHSDDDCVRCAMIAQDRKKNRKPF